MCDMIVDTAAVNWGVAESHIDQLCTLSMVHVSTYKVNIIFYTITNQHGILLSFADQIHWLILSQFSHKWRNMVKFSKGFIFGIIERIKMQIATLCHICHQKREG